jgi:TolB protein
LADWSGDGTRALFYDRRQDDSTDVIQVDLDTGTQTRFNVKQFDVVPRYTRPEGKAVLLAKSNDVDSPPSLVRVDLAGNHQLTYPIEQFGTKVGPDFLATPDGTRLVLGTEAGGLAVMGNDGTGVKTLPVPGQQYCSPARWWDVDSMITVADCHDAEYDRQLWLVPIDGGAPTLLTQPNNEEESEILGVFNAWKLPQSTFLQAHGGCGYIFLAKVDTFGGTPTKVSVPNVDEHSSVGVIGVYHGNLELRASLACGDGQSLLSYDPGTGTSTVLLGGTVNGGGVVAALAYPGYE